MTHPDVHRLLDAVLPMAQRILEKHGQFHPFGAAIDADGDVAGAMADPGDANGTPQAVADLLEEAFRRQAASGALRGCAVCVDVRVTLPEDADPTDAICVRIELADDEPLDVLLPYARTADGTLRCGELLAMAGERRVFAPGPPWNGPPGEGGQSISGTAPGPPVT